MKTRILGKLASALIGASLFMSGIAPALAEADLGDKMEQMGKALGAIKRQVGDPTKKDASLALIAKLRSATVAAREMAPKKARTVAEDKRAEFIADYKAAMDDLIKQIDRLAAAVKDNKPEAQQAALKEIEDSKSDGHVTYRTKHSEKGKSEKKGKKEREED